ncbi:hypothetical protein [Streptomyces sp. NRRL B-1140]|uniref:hypothetical protein n=1 Tax=Streptomyces sp. NRRL B-1140 TaxID=1415549 RepID=UPI000AF78444|nr:hypothetical protein [Streptomyces sp. NRRL B-1140]
MNDRQAPEWLDTLGRCGLEVMGKAAPDGPPVNAAIHAVSGFEVEPVTAIPASSPHAADELDDAWHRHAAQVSLYGKDGEFLILPPVPGGSQVGWMHVKDPVGKNAARWGTRPVSARRRVHPSSLPFRLTAATCVPPP